MLISWLILREGETIRIDFDVYNPSDSLEPRGISSVMVGTSQLGATAVGLANADPTYQSADPIVRSDDT